MRVPNWTIHRCQRFGSSERAIPDGNEDDELLLFPSPLSSSVASIVMVLQPQASQMGRILSLQPDKASKPLFNSHYYRVHQPMPCLSANIPTRSLWAHWTECRFVARFLISMTEPGKWITPAPYPGGSSRDAYGRTIRLSSSICTDGHSRLMLADPGGKRFYQLLPYDLAPLGGL